MKNSFSYINSDLNITDPARQRRSNVNTKNLLSPLRRERQDPATIPIIVTNVEDIIICAYMSLEYVFKRPNKTGGAKVIAANEKVRNKSNWVQGRAKFKIHNKIKTRKNIKVGIILKYL